MSVMINNRGMINLNQVFKLTFTIAREGSNSPVGAKKDMMHIPDI